jgi:hypothetical protein
MRRARGAEWRWVDFEVGRLFRGGAITQFLGERDQTDVCVSHPADPDYLTWWIR